MSSEGVAAERLYDSAEARRLLGAISERKFRQLTASGELPIRRQGAYVYVEAAAIREYIAGLPTAQLQPCAGGCPDPRVYSSVEVRELLGGVSETTFRRLVASGELPARRRGRHVVVTKADLSAYIAGLPPFIDDEKGVDSVHTLGGG